MESAKLPLEHEQPIGSNTDTQNPFFKIQQLHADEEDLAAIERLNQADNLNKDKGNLGEPLVPQKPDIQYLKINMNHPRLQLASKLFLTLFIFSLVTWFLTVGVVALSFIYDIPTIITVTNTYFCTVWYMDVILYLHKLIAIKVVINFAKALKILAGQIVMKRIIFYIYYTGFFCYFQSEFGEWTDNQLLLILSCNLFGFLLFILLFFEGFLLIRTYKDFGDQAPKPLNGPQPVIQQQNIEENDLDPLNI